MPKVVSRGTISTSDSAPETASSKAILRTYYCLCGEFVLVIDRQVDRLPRRQYDGASIVRCKDDPSIASLPPPRREGDEATQQDEEIERERRKKSARKFKLNTVDGKRVLMKRQSDGALEPRQTFHCSRCNLVIAYQTGPPPAGSGEWMYIMRGAVTEQQGRPPADAFDGEDLFAQTEEEAAMAREMEAQEARDRLKMDKETLAKLERQRRMGQSHGGTTQEVFDDGFGDGAPMTTSFDY